MSRNKINTICVLGLGYMGLPTASLIANSGYNVIGVDVNKDKIKLLRKRILPFSEKGLTEIVLRALDSKKLSVQTTISQADIFIIAVPTPIDSSKQAELKFVKSATEMVAQVIKKNDLVILESTVPPGTVDRIVLPILKDTGLELNKDYYLSHCPERAIPGNTLYELVNNDRIIGGSNAKAIEMTKEVYSSFVKGEVIGTDITTAETVKLMENTTRDVSIALANEFAKIAEDIGVNIWEAIELANRHPRVNILLPGPGVGGHCIAVDPWFLVEQSENAVIIKTARLVNDSMPNHVIKLINNTIGSIDKPVITFLGVAYKANVDDARETPAEEIIDRAKLLGWEVRVHDYYVDKSEFPGLLDLESACKESDCLVLLTNHDKYALLDPKKIKNQMSRHNLVDTRNFLNHATWKKAGFKVAVLGNGKSKAV